MDIGCVSACAESGEVGLGIVVGLRMFSCGAEEAGMKGWRERAADIFAKHGEIAAEMKSAPGPTDLRADRCGASPYMGLIVNVSSLWS